MIIGNGPIVNNYRVDKLIRQAHNYEHKIYNTLTTIALRDRGWHTRTESVDSSTYTNRANPTFEYDRRETRSITTKKRDTCNRDRYSNEKQDIPNILVIA